MHNVDVQSTIELLVVFDKYANIAALDRKLICSPRFIPEKFTAVHHRPPWAVIILGDIVTRVDFAATNSLLCFGTSTAWLYQKRALITLHPNPPSATVQNAAKGDKPLLSLSLCFCRPGVTYN